MKILQINKFYHIVGGVDRYFLELSKLLSEKGHDIVPFSMQHPLNYKTRWSKYFVPHSAFDTVKLSNGIHNFIQMIYNIEARRRISALLDTFPADVAHVHQIYHHISPSILFELKRRRIPIVHTVGDYHLISPHHNNLYHNGNICEVSKVKKFYKTVFHKCIKESYLASVAEATEQYVHHYLGFYQNTIDYYISPSAYLTKKLIEYQIPQEKIVQIPYFVYANSFKINDADRRYVLYFGRLSSEKGLDFLLTVAKLIPEIPIKIIGSGSEGVNLLKRVFKDQLKNVEVINRFIPENTLRKYVAECSFTVFPSLSYEIFGISLLESFASGKPVITSRIGAFPEIVEDGIEGFLFETGNIRLCVKQIQKLWSDNTLCKTLGENARKRAVKQYNPQDHYDKLIALYHKVVRQNSIIHEESVFKKH